MAQINSWVSKGTLSNDKKQAEKLTIKRKQYEQEHEFFKVPHPTSPRAYILKRKKFGLKGFA